MTPAARQEHLRGLESFLRDRLRGQDHVLPRAAALFHRGELGLASQQRPRGSFLAVGPTGVGKTELTLLCGEYVFGQNHVCRFNLSEYAREDAVARFLGGNAQDRGAFGDVMQGRKRGILLFDEIEKAYWRLWDLFLQLLDPGYITLASGETISVAGFYLGFSSNIGGAEAMRMEQSRFASVEQAVLRLVTNTLRPELVGRIQEKWVFARLPPDVQREVCGLRVKDEVHRLRGLGYDLRVSPEAIEFLVREGFHSQLGARPLRHAVESHLQDAVVRGLFAIGAASGEVIPETGGRTLVIKPF